MKNKTKLNTQEKTIKEAKMGCNPEDFLVKRVPNAKFTMPFEYLINLK